jgi:hypothetical protein
MEVLDKFKIHIKSKTRMIIPICQMVVRLIVHPTLKINVMKMEQTLMGYKEGERVFMYTYKIDRERLSLWPTL